MGGKIIDSTESLLRLSEDDLTEILLQEKYNKANLRELLRRVLKDAKEYKQAFKYQLELNKQLEEKLEQIKN